MDQALHHDKIQNEVDTEVSLDDLDEVNGGCSVLVVRPITPNCDLVKSATDVNNTTTEEPGTDFIKDSLSVLTNEPIRDAVKNIVNKIGGIT